MSDRGKTDIQLGHRLAEVASELARIADDMRGMDRRGSYVDPTAAAERALSHLPVGEGRHATSAELSEAVKELAHGLASLTRQVI